MYRVDQTSKCVSKIRSLIIRMKIKGAISQGYCKDIVEDIKQTTPGSTDHNIHYWSGGGGGGRGVFFAGIELYLDKLVQVFLSLNPRASVPSVATDDRKQFQCLHIVWNNKTEQLSLEFDWCEDKF